MKSLKAIILVLVLFLVNNSIKAQDDIPIILSTDVVPVPWNSSVAVQINLYGASSQQYYCCIIIKKYSYVPVSRLPGPVVYGWRWIYCTYIIDLPPGDPAVVQSIFPTREGEIFDINDYQVTGPYLRY
jgi:hypothetical protein